MMTFGWFFLGVYITAMYAHLQEGNCINPRDWTHWVSFLITLIVLPFAEAWVCLIKPVVLCIGCGLKYCMKKFDRFDIAHYF